MTHRSALLALLTAFAFALVGAQASFAHDDHGGHRRHGHVVFVQTNELTGNEIVVYRRRHDGSLQRAGTYATGGSGGAAAPGTESDRLASQGSLAYDREHKLLIAVNAGSNTISVFRVRGPRLTLESVLPSGGQFPASIAVHDELVYVLNAGGAGSVQGFRIHHRRLSPLTGSARSRGLANSSPPNFLMSPGQVGFTPDGGRLLVTTKASTSSIDVFQVGADGRLSAAPVVNPSATPVPFAFTFDPVGRLVMGEAGTSSVTTYTINGNGTLADARSLSDHQVALCWIQRVGDVYYVANTGSNTLSAYRIDATGQPSLVTPSGIVATTEAGPIDLTPSSDGRYLY